MTRAGLRALRERVERGAWTLPPWPRRMVSEPACNCGCGWETTRIVKLPCKRGQKRRGK